MSLRSFILLIVAVLVAGALTGVVYFYYKQRQQKEEFPVLTQPEVSYTYLRIFFPVGDRLEVFEKRVEGRFLPVQMAEMLIKEYISLSEEMHTGLIPEGTKLKGAYLSSEGIIYLDFDKVLARRFNGDVMDELMFLRSIYETMISNLEINDVVVLFDGKEEESLGGHFFINRPLKETVGGL